MPLVNSKPFTIQGTINQEAHPSGLTRIAKTIKSLFCCCYSSGTVTAIKDNPAQNPQSSVVTPPPVVKTDDFELPKVTLAPATQKLHGAVSHITKVAVDTHIDHYLKDDEFKKIKQSVRKITDVLQVCTRFAIGSFGDGFINIKAPSPTFIKFMQSLLKDVENREGVQQAAQPNNSHYQADLDAAIEWICAIKDGTVENFVLPEGVAEEDLESAFLVCLKNLSNNKIEKISEKLLKAIKPAKCKPLIKELINGNLQTLSSIIMSSLGKRIETADCPKLFDQCIKDIADTLKAVTQNNLSKELQATVGTQGTPSDKEIAARLIHKFAGLLFDTNNITEDHPLILMLTNLTLPKELEEPVKELKDALHEHFSQLKEYFAQLSADTDNGLPGVGDLLKQYWDQIKGPTLDLLVGLNRVGLTLSLTDIVAKHLSTQLQGRRMDELFGTIILPQINDQLIVTTILADLKARHKEYQPYFKPESLENQEPLQKALIDSLEATHIQELESIKKRIPELLTPIYNQLMESCKTHSLPEALDLFSSQCQRETDPALKEILEYTIRDKTLGNLTLTNGLDWVFKLIQNSVIDGLAKTASDSTTEMRASHEYLTNQIAEALMNSPLAKQETLNELLFGNTPSMSSSATDMHKNSQIALTSALLYNTVISGTPWLQRVACQTALENGKVITKTINNLYERTLRKPEFVKCVITKMANTIINGLEKAAPASRLVIENRNVEQLVA